MERAYNAQEDTYEYVDMFAAGIIDPTKVRRSHRSDHELIAWYTRSWFDFFDFLRSHVLMPQALPVFSQRRKP